MKIFLIITLIWTAIACNTQERKEFIPTSDTQDIAFSADWKRINECGIEFYIPSNLKAKAIQPIDSCAKQYNNENISLLIDVLEGSNSDGAIFTRSKEYSSRKDFKLEKINIDGRQAEIITFVGTGRKGLDYGAVLDIPQINLTMWAYCTSQEQRETAIQIFKSVIKPAP